MNTKIFIFVLFLFACDVTRSILDESPWFVINNATALPFICQLEAIEYVERVSDITVDEDVNKAFSLQWAHKQDAQGKMYLKLLIFFDCQPGEAITCEPLFYRNEVAIIPTITSVGFIQNDLQLLNFCQPAKSQDCYISIDFDDYEGFTMSSRPIPLYIKIASNAHRAFSGLLASIAKLTNYLPY